MYYVAQSDIESYLSITLTGNGVTQFQALQTNVQASVDKYCNRTWNFTNPVTEYFNMFRDGTPMQLEDTFFTKAPISQTPFNSSYPQAGGINSVTVGAVNGVGGQLLDLTYCYNFGMYFKVFSWFAMQSMFNPLGFKAVQVIYNSDDAGNVPLDVKQACIEWIARKMQTAPDSGREVNQVQAGTIRAMYKDDAKGGIPDFVKLVLDKYIIYAGEHL